MEDLRKYFDALDKVENSRPLFSDKELSDHLSIGKTKLRLPKKINWRIIMSITAVLLVTSILFFSQFENENQVVEKSDIKEGSYSFKENIEENPRDSITVEINKTSSENKAWDTTVIENEHFIQRVTGSNTEEIIFKLVPDGSHIPPPKQIKKENIMKEYDIAGINMIELSMEEMNKLDIEITDTSMFFYRERIYDTLFSDYDKKLFFSKGYDTLNFPILVRRYFKRINNRFMMDPEFVTEYSGWSIEDYSRILHVACHSLDQNNRKFSWRIEPSPILRFGDSIFSAYYQYERNLSKERSKFLRENTETIKDLQKRYPDSLKIIMNKMYEEMRKEEKKLLERLVPVYFKWDSNPSMYAFIFWYVPNEEFLDAIPPRYAEPLRRELKAIELHDKYGIPLKEACKGIEDEKSIYQFCRMESGALEIQNISPNPGSEKIECEFEISEPRKITINMHDVSGKLIDTIIKDKSFDKGAHSVIMNLSNYEDTMFYLLSIVTDKGETASKRIMIK